MPLMKGNKSNYLIRCFLCCISALLFLSCSQKSFSTEKEFWDYIKNPKNGLSQQKNTNGVDYSLTYKPTDALVKQELGEEYSTTQVDSLRKKYQEYIYLTLSMSKNNQELLNSKVKNRSEFGAMVNQLAFGMAEKVNLISKARDTIAMADYVYPRMYGMGGGTSMLLVYPREEKIMKNDFFHFTIEDLGFMTGEVSFRVATEPIKNEPRLKFK